MPMTNCRLEFFSSSSSLRNRSWRGNSIPLMADFNAHMGNRETWRGVILDFCASHCLSVTNTMSEHKVVH